MIAPGIPDIKHILPHTTVGWPDEFEFRIRPYELMMNGLNARKNQIMQTAVENGWNVKCVFSQLERANVIIIARPTA